MQAGQRQHGLLQTLLAGRDAVLLVLSKRVLGVTGLLHHRRTTRSWILLGIGDIQTSLQFTLPDMSERHRMRYVCDWLRKERIQPVRVRADNTSLSAAVLFGVFERHSVPVLQLRAIRAVCHSYK